MTRNTAMAIWALLLISGLVTCVRGVAAGDTGLAVLAFLILCVARVWYIVAVSLEDVEE